MDKKKIFLKYRPLIDIALKWKNKIVLKRNIRGKNNEINGLGGVLVKNSSISIWGNNNIINLGEMSQIYGVHITICGDGNKIEIGSCNYLRGCAFALEESNNQIITGSHTYIYNNTEIAALEGTCVILGEDCLVSSDVVIRTGDSHRIESLPDGKRINYSRDVIVGNHVWIGKRGMLLKGTTIKKGCIVAAGAIVTASCKANENAVIGGNPASVLRENCTWQHLRGQ